MARASHADLIADGNAALARAVISLGHRAANAGEGSTDELTIDVDGMVVPVEIEAASVVVPEVVARMLSAHAVRGKGVATVVVGDLITARAKTALREAGWGWLDRRGHLVLRAKGVHIDADVLADERTRAGTVPKPISGVAAISWAAALLLCPDDPPSMREVGRRIGISHSAVVAAAKKMRAASLVGADGLPIVPELFWTLAEVWPTERVPLAQLPPVGDGQIYGLNLNLDGEGPGWAVAGTVGAVAWGAPMAIGKAYPPDFYLPSAAELRRATLRLGEAARFEDRECTVAVAPTPLVCRARHDREGGGPGHWPFADGLFAALDLAQDHARGADLLADWEPQDFTRAW